MYESLAGKKVKTTQEARFKVYEKLYYKLETKDGRKNIYRITRLRERKTRDLD